MKQYQNCRDGHSLRENLARATSVKEILVDLKFGATFKDASERTRRAWAATAARRTAQLGVA